MLTHFAKLKNLENPTLILLHGFISDHTTFHLVEETLVNQGINVITIDLPGHGDDNSNGDLTWDMAYIADQIKSLIMHYNLKNVYIHGYSMGGRVALSFANQFPTMIEGLILESASPGISNDVDKQARIEIDKNRASYIQEVGLKQFVKEWSKLPLFDSQSILTDTEKQRIEQMRLSQQPEGLSKALIEYGTGAQPSYWEVLHQFNVPTCIIVGEKDAKFINIGQRMHQLMKKSTFHMVQDAGHTIHVEQPTKFDTIVIEFILGGKLCQDNGKR